MTQDDNYTHIMQLAAIAMAAGQNTAHTILGRITKDSPYWTTAYADVCDAVNREMRWREACEKARHALESYVNDLTYRDDAIPVILEALDHLKDWRFKDTHEPPRTL